MSKASIYSSVFKSGYYVTAELKVLDMQRVAEMKKALAHLQQATLEEAGCHIFEIHQDINNPSRVVLWECFENEAALQHHFTLEHTKDYLDNNFTEVVNVIKTNLLFEEN